jgi:hypothetical protein
MVDLTRLRHSFEGIARGLYFHEFSCLFTGFCTIISELFYNTIKINEKAKSSNLFIERSIELLKREQLSWKSEIKGENPRVFNYQFSPKDDLNTQTFCMNFYEKTTVYVIFGHEDKLEKIKENIEIMTALLHCIKT